MLKAQFFLVLHDPHECDKILQTFSHAKPEVEDPHWWLLTREQFFSQAKNWKVGQYHVRVVYFHLSTHMIHMYAMQFYNFSRKCSYICD